jgi:hypothetical protein
MTLVQQRSSQNMHDIIGAFCRLVKKIHVNFGTPNPGGFVILGRLLIEAAFNNPGQRVEATYSHKPRIVMDPVKSKAQLVTRRGNAYSCLPTCW